MNGLRKSLTACGIHLTETASVLPHIQVLWCRQAPGVSGRKLRDHSEAPGDASVESSAKDADPACACPQGTVHHRAQ